MTPGHLLPAGYLRTCGSQIVDSDDRPVRLAGVNWYGFECTGFVVGGLDVQTVDAIAERIVALGFNVVRLPFSVQLVLENPAVTDYLEVNPALQGLEALEIMDIVIRTLSRYGLKVILGCHRSEAGWSWQSNGLWYTEDFPELSFERAWDIVIRRFAADPHVSQPTVIGCDLRNEPAAPPKDPEAWPANGGSTWGFGDDNPTGRPRDWAAAAERIGNRILAINSSLLVIVEGVRDDPAGPYLDGNRHMYWPGGNLCGVERAGGSYRSSPRPLRLAVPNRLVYSAHDYGPDMYRHIAWCRQGSTASTPEACYSVWDQTWGSIALHGTAPVLIGEFGTVNGYKPGDATPREYYTDPNPYTAQGAWFTYLVQYIQERGIHWTYWCLNGSQSPGPGRDPVQADWYGVLTPDWSDDASEPMMERLRAIQ